MTTKISQIVFALPQYFLPHHLLSRIMQAITHSTQKTWKNILIKVFCQTYQVNLDDAEQPDIEGYTSFNDFFTRALKPGKRPTSRNSESIVCPADGMISQIGFLKNGRLLQAKGRDYGIVDLVGGDEKTAAPFVDGCFATIYLSPRDYHRLHMPETGTLKKMIHIPGRLFSVNTATTAVIPNLFTRNERVIAVFDTTIGPMALVLVGAIFVSSIETVWHGVVTPPTQNTIRQWNYDSKTGPRQLVRGEEMGRFNMGSTIIVLFGKQTVHWLEGARAGKNVMVGEDLGYKMHGDDSKLILESAT
ncbi:MAG: archaetidylserine decarboxylase [Methylococcales bacterium]